MQLRDTEFSNNSGGATFRLVTLDVMEAAHESYAYDTSDRRVLVSKNLDNNGVFTDPADAEEAFVYDGAEIALVFNKVNEVQNRYLHGPGVDEVLAEENPAIEAQAPQPARVTPDVSSDATTYFDGGRSFPAGSYTIKYVSGAVDYTGDTIANDWTVNHGGFYVHHSVYGSTTTGPAPGTDAKFATVGEVEAASAGQTVTITHPGGPIGMRLADTGYTDNRGDGVTFELVGETSDDSGVRWLLGDHQNSVRQVIDDHGGVKDKIDYDGFGIIKSETNPANAPRFGYTGQEHDRATGMSFTGGSGASYFVDGLFIRQDPGYPALAAHPYAYTGNRPVDGVDRNGFNADFGSAFRFDLGGGNNGGFGTMLSGNAFNYGTSYGDPFSLASAPTTRPATMPSTMPASMPVSAPMSMMEARLDLQAGIRQSFISGSPTYAAALEKANADYSRALAAPRYDGPTIYAATPQQAARRNDARFQREFARAVRIEQYGPRDRGEENALRADAFLRGEGDVMGRERGTSQLLTRCDVPLICPWAATTWWTTSTATAGARSARPTAGAGSARATAAAAATAGLGRWSA